jgi:hypothetical protein
MGPEYPLAVFTLSHSIPVRPILILYFYLSLGVKSVLFPSSFPTEILYFFPFVLDASRSHPLLFDHSNNTSVC